MKRILSIIALTAPLVLNAQTGVHTTHPANPEGRLLTTEETELGRHIRPASVSASWKDSDTFTTFKDGKWIQENLLTGEISDYSATRLPEGFPKEAGNITRSDDGTFAYTIGQSLYIFDNGPVSVAVSENPDITYGQSVSRNEFGIGEGIFWAPDGSKLAFYRKDESKVTDFPLLDITTRTGSLKSIKYPMNGMDSERISLGIYDRASGKTVWCDVNEYGDDRYLTNISWSPDSRNIFIQVVDRSQKHMKLNMYRAADGSFARTILTEDELPQTLTSYSPCFRKEKGAHGIEERGIYRIHQFEKQEMIVVCKPEDSKAWYEKMWRYSVELFRSLDIPVRQLECCSGDLADLKCKSCDIEAWSPRQQKYFEVCSCSNLGDAQARRLKIRVRGEDGKLYLPHTLNNTVVAPPRMLIALLENNLQADGSVLVPKALQPYMGGKERLVPLH